MARGLLFILILLFVFPASGASRLREICASADIGRITQAETLEGLADGCHLLQQNSTGPIAELAGHVLGIVEAVRNSGDRSANWRQDRGLNEAINTLGLQIAETRAITDNPAINTRRELRDLLTNFGDASARRDNFEAYYAAMKNVIAQTSAGAEVAGCLETINHPSVIETYAYGTDEVSPVVGAMDLVPDPETPRRSYATLSINTRVHPLRAISVVAHELKHACNINHSCRVLDSCPDQNNCPAADEEFVIDEIRGHVLEAQVFAELAAADPEVFCSITDTIDGRPARLADYLGGLEEAAANGTLVNQIAEKYIRANIWRPETIYRPGTTELRPELIERIRRAGFAVP